MACDRLGNWCLATRSSSSFSTCSSRDTPKRLIAMDMLLISGHKGKKNSPNNSVCFSITNHRYCISLNQLVLNCSPVLICIVSGLLLKGIDQPDALADIIEHFHVLQTELVGHDIALLLVFQEQAVHFLDFITETCGFPFIGIFKASPVIF